METHLFEESRRALLGLAPFSLNSTYDFVPEVYKTYKVPENMLAVFSVRPWTKAESEGAKKAVIACSQLYNTDKQEDYSKAESEMLEFVRKALVGWSNFIDAGNGEQITFVADASGGCDKKLWERFPDVLVVDLANKCNLISGISTAEKLGLKS